MYEIAMALRHAPEVYVDIPGYEGYYQVSNYGNVRSLDRVIKEKTGKTQTLKDRILKQRTNPSGYYYIGLGKNGSKATFAIHQLVAQAFLDNPNNKPTVNHITGIKTDNNVSNLEWATYSENLEHAYNSGLRASVSSKALGKKNYKRKLKTEQVLEIKHLLAAGNMTHKEIAKKYGVSRSTVGNINSNRYWSHITVSNAKCSKKSTTRNSGSKNNFSKLDESLVLRIKLALSCGVAVELLASQYDVASTTIYEIKRGATWQHVSI
jgi:DNA-binding XRE family transcriptional regulator